MHLQIGHFSSLIKLVTGIVVPLLFGLVAIFAINAIKNVPDAKLAESVKLFGRFELTKGQAMDKAFEHQTHHRGQATVYIRLAGATPPQEKLF